MKDNTFTGSRKIIKYTYFYALQYLIIINKMKKNVQSYF